MPSLLVTQNAGSPLFKDWEVDNKRRPGQVYAGEQFLFNFGSGADVGTVVKMTLDKCISGDFSMWLRYDGDMADSFAHVVRVEDRGFAEELEENEKEIFLIEGRRARQYKIDLHYRELVDTGFQTPIVYADDGDGVLEIRVREDSPPGDKKRKRMNVVVPSDYRTFDDTYLRQMAGDVENLSPDEDPKYLLSSLTFRRCL